MNLNDTHLWTALVTPLTPGREVDFHSFKTLLKEQEAAGNGVLILGSTGEALNLSLSARQAIVDYTLEQNLKVPVMVGVGAHDLASQLEWCAWLETKSIHAYLMCTPIYAKPGDEGQYEWFQVLMDAVTKPVMLYNVPGRAGKELSYSAIRRLNTHKNFWAIKEASGSVAKMKEYLAATDGNGVVYCGDDGLMPVFANSGASGLVSVAGNTWPKETHLYVEQSLAKTLNAKNPWVEASDSLFIASNPVPAKALLCVENRISHDTMMPPLSRNDLKSLDELTTQSKRVRAWFQAAK